MEIKLINSDKKVIIDDENKQIAVHKWRLSTNGYVRATISHNRVFIHRFLMNAPKGTLIDHKNGNTLDNRISNLRFCSTQQNIANSKIKREGKKSKYKGVRFDTSMKRRKRWMAACEIKGKCHTIGRYATQEEAALAYNKKAKELWGEFARLNDIASVIQK